MIRSLLFALLTLRARGELYAARRTAAEAKAARERAEAERDEGVARASRAESVAADAVAKAKAATAAAMEATAAMDAMRSELDVATTTAREQSAARVLAEEAA